jgi:hypothetical protein
MGFDELHQEVSLTRQFLVAVGGGECPVARALPTGGAPVLLAVLPADHESFLAGAGIDKLFTARRLSRLLRLE